MRQKPDGSLCLTSRAPAATPAPTARPTVSAVTSADERQEREDRGTDDGSADTGNDRCESGLNGVNVSEAPSHEIASLCVGENRQYG